MSARVKIPIRLRVDLDALRGERDDLEDALAAALARAFASARTKVVAPRGGALEVRPIAPTFVWGGAAAGQVGPSVRAATEAHVRRLVEDALVQSGILARDPETPEVLPEEASEPVDADRVRVGGYVTPSYGEDEDVLHALLTERSVTHPDEFEFHWYSPQDHAEFVLLFAQVLARELGAIPTSGYYGAIERGPRVGKGYQMVFYVYDLAKCNFAKPGTVEPVIKFGDVIHGVDFDPKSHTFQDKRPSLPPRGEYVFKRVWPFSTLDQRTEYITMAESAEIRARIVADPVLGKHADDNLKIAIQKRVASIPASPTVVLEVRTPGNNAMSMPRDTDFAGMPPLPVSLYPIAFGMVRDPNEKKDDKKGEGDGDGTGKQDKDGGGGKGGKGKGGDQFHEGQDGEGDGGGGGGGYLVGDGTGDGTGAFRFPPGVGGEGELVCEPFEDEPPVDQWPQAAAMQRLIHIVADRLQMPECRFPGKFCINAARVLGGRAAAIGAQAVTDESFTAELKPRSDGFVVDPLPTIAVQFLRHLGGTVPYLTRLLAYLMEPRGAPWMLHFLKEYAPQIKESIGWIFVYACQIAFLQQLRYSRKQIDLRVEKFETGYADFFEETVLQLLTDTATLGLLREDLVAFLATRLDSVDAVARGAVDAWRRSHRGDDVTTEAMLDSAAAPGNKVVQPASWQEAQDDVLGLAKPAGSDASATALAKSQAGTFGKKGKDWAIRDAKGRLWSLKDLDTAIALQSNTAESVDPLVKQILDVEGLVPLFKANPWMIKPHLKRLLAEMQQKNDEITQKVSGEAMWAFTHGPITEDIAHATIPYMKYALGGIHLNAHALIYDAFGGDEYYAEGLNYLFDSEQGWRDIKQFFIIGGILILAVLCPEAAAIVGILQAAYEKAEADEMKDVYRALIDPDVAISKAEQINQFMAELMLAVSIIPEAGTIMKGASGLTQAAIKGTLKEFAKEALESILKQVIKALQKNLLLAFVKEVVVLEVFQTLMGKLAAPLQKAIFEANSLPEGSTAVSAKTLGMATAGDVLGDNPQVATLAELPEVPVGEGD